MGKEFVRISQLTGNVKSLGQVHFFDDFSSDLGYDETVVGNGEAVRSIDKSVLAGISLKHQVADDTATATDSIRSQKRVPSTPDQFLNLQCYFMFSSAALPHTIDFKVTLTKGTDLLQFAIQYDVTAEALKYLNSGGGYTSFNAYSAPPDDDYWHKLNVIFDGLNQKYVSCQLDNDTFSLADISCQVTTGRSNINHYVDVYTNGTANTNFDVWFDHLLLKSFS